MSGSCASAAAIARRLRQPPDNDSVRASKSVNPARPSVSAILDGRSSCGTDASVMALSTTERTVSFPANSEACVTQLSRVPLRTARSPLSGFTRPYKISSKVDLPEPLGPIRPMRSPSDTVNEIFLNRGATPNFFERSCALMIGPELLNLLFLLLQVYTRIVPPHRRTGMGKSSDHVQRDPPRSSSY